MTDYSVLWSRQWLQYPFTTSSVVLPGEDIRDSVNRQLDEMENPLSEEFARTLVQCTTALRCRLTVDECTGEFVQTTSICSFQTAWDVSVRVYPAEVSKPGDCVRDFSVAVFAAAGKSHHVDVWISGHSFRALVDTSIDSYPMLAAYDQL